jgi:hypothetical protein
MTQPWEVASGGIGGPFDTLKFTLPIPAGSNLTAGSNTIAFTFNGTDGVGSGFRILAFNLEDASGNMLLPPIGFTQVNPATWTAPLNNPTDIAAGASLWASAPLIFAPGQPAILAHCQDCHAVSGRDLKYFNYSNYSIIARSEFHGLSQLQGQQIASYIRAGAALASVPDPGLPWNPPYQAGPGLLAQTVANWSAGAGLAAVLDNDTDALPYLFPDGVGSAADVSATGWIAFANIPEALQFQDWNHWLPMVAPIDSWGAGVWNSSNAMLNRYNSMRASLTNNKTAYIAGTPPGQPSAFNQDLYNFIQPDRGFFADSCSSDVGAMKVLDTAHWQLVKNWELNQDFGLESLIPAAEGFQTSVRAITPSAVVDRAWDGDVPFMISDNRLCGAGNQQHVMSFTPDAGANGPFDAATANSWYNIQMEVNGGYRSRSANNPVDWAYEYNAIGKMHWFLPYATPVLFAEIMTKAFQENVSPARGGCAANANGQCLDQSFGWNPTWGGEVQEAVFGEFINGGFGPFWNALPGSTVCMNSSPYICTGPTVSAIMTALVKSWLTETQLWTKAQYVTEGVDSVGYVPNSGYDSNVWGDRIRNMLPLFSDYGVDSATLGQVCTWAQGEWPDFQWSQLQGCGGTLTAPHKHKKHRKHG